MTEPSQGGSASIREVYKLVNEVDARIREELGGKIDKLGEGINTIVASHEHRLTIVEQEQATQDERITALVKRVDGYGNEISVMKDKQSADEAATHALQTARATSSTNRQWVVGLVVLLVASGVGSLIGVIVH